MSHTPGPWKVDAGGFPILIEGPQGEYVASIEAATADGDEQGQINAALIAAAPELLQALEQALRYIEVSVAYKGTMTADEVEKRIKDNQVSQVEIAANSCKTLARFNFDQTRAALAKARGQA